MIEELDQVEEQQQQDPPSKTKALYDAVSKKYDLGTFDEFEKKLQDPKKRESFYNGVGSEYDLGTYQEFESKVKKKDGGTPLPTTTSPTQSPSNPPLQSKKENSLFGYIKENLFRGKQEMERRGIPTPKIEAKKGFRPKDLAEFPNALKPENLNEHLKYQKEKQDNRTGYIVNGLLDGIESLGAGAIDVAVTGILADARMRGVTYIGEKPIEQIHSEWRDFKEENRGSVSKMIGSDVTPEQKERYDNELLTSTVKGLAESAPGMATGYVGMLIQAYDNGLKSVNNTEEGKSLPESTKTFFGLGTGLATSALDKFSLNKIFGKQSSKVAAGLAAKTMTELLKKSKTPITTQAFEAALEAGARDLKQQVITKGKKYAEGVITETGTEALQEGIAMLGEETLNKIEGKQIFEPTSWADKMSRVALAAKQGAVGGGILGGVALPFSETRNYIAEKVASAKSSEDIDNLKREVVEQAEKGEVSEEDINEMTSLVDKYVEVNSKIPDTVPDRKKAADKIIEREEVENKIAEKEREMEGVDVAFHPELQTEIELLKERVGEINESLVNPSVGEDAEQEGGEDIDTGAELPDTYIINGEKVTEKVFDDAIENAKNTKEKLDVEYNGDDEVRIQKIIDLGGSTENGKTVIAEEVPEQKSSVKQEVKRIVEPTKTISEMNSEEMSDFATETRKALKKQDKEFEGKTEQEKEESGYYDIIDDVEDLRDAAERINFIENAENVNDLANSVKSTLSTMRGGSPNEYQLAILNSAKNKAIELGIGAEDLIKKISTKIASEYRDIEDAEFMVRNAIEKLIPKNEPKAAELPKQKKINESPTTEVTKPVQQDAGVPEQQGTKEAVLQSTEPIGQGNAETTTTVLEKGNSVGVGGDVDLGNNTIIVNMSLPLDSGVNTGLVKNSKGAVYHDKNTSKLEKLGYSKEQIDKLSQAELDEILAKNIENPNVETSAKMPLAEKQTTTQEFLNEANKEGGRFAELAKALKQFFGIDGVETEIVKGLKDFFGKNNDGDYANNKIRIDEKAKNKLQTFLHEAIHKVTVDKLLQFERGDYSKLSKQDIEAIQNLTRIFNESKAKIHEFLGGGKGDRTKGHYGFTNVHEFISEAFTNPEFQSLLKNLPTEGNNPTIFKQFLDAVAKFLGLKDASILNDIFYYTENLNNKAVEQSLKETTKAGSVGEVKAELPAQKVEQLRLQEQAEYDAMPNPKDEAERKRIYDKYDKLISPLLDEGEVKAQVPPPSEPPVDKTKESEIKIVEDIEEQDLSGIRKKLVSDEIIKGVDLDRISDKEMMGLGRKILDSGEVNPEAIVTKIITEGKGVLTPTEVVALITYKRDIDNQLSDVYKKINEKKSAKEDIGTLGVEAKSLERQINDFDVMAVITAQQQSMAFRLRQRMLDRDYNVVTQIEKYKSVNNGEIPADIESKFRELDKQLKEVKDKLVDAERQIQEKEAQNSVDNIKESVDREKSYTEEELNKKIEEGVESEISKLYEELPEQKRSAADKAIKALEKFRAKLKSRTYESTLGIPAALADLGAVTAIRAIKIGKTVAEAVEIGINRIKKSLKQKGIDKWDEESEYRKELSDTLESEGVSTKNKTKNNPVINKDGTVTIPNEMLRDLVKMGITDINDLVDEIHSKVSKELPEITKRQVRDYITGYGKTVNPTSDKLQTQISTAKRVGRLLSELEDLKKMGEVEFLAKYQKTKPSKNKILERERELKRQIKSLSKDIADIDNTKTDEERLILTKESVTRRIDELKRKIKNKDFSKNKKNQSVTDSELVELNKQKEKIQAEFDDLQYQNELKNRGTWQKVEDAAYEATSGLLRGLTLSLDMSAGLVQGIRKLFTNPGKSVKAFVESIKHLVSEKYSEDYLAKHKAQSYFPLIKASKLAIDDKSGKVSVKEGMFISNWINLVWDKLVSPVIGFGTKKGTSLVRKINPYLASQRAYDGYVNSIRIQSFLQIAKQIENDGYTFESNPEVFKKAADFVNTTTGRGSLGQADANSKWLNIFLTAPRKVISELKLYTPYALVYYSRMPKAVRKKAFLDFAKFATSFITTNALIWAATKNWDDEEEDKKDNFWNPNSSDFLTHKIGDNRISVAGGMKSIINFQSRFITGEFTDQYGKTTKLGERFGKDINTRFDLLTRFITGKSAPAFNVALKKLDERKGKEMSNEEIIKSLTVPLWMQDIKELYKDDPATVGAFLTAMSILGANVRSVEKSKSDIDKEELSKNPKLKYFIDKGYNFPEMNPEKIQTKEINNKVVERLSQYDDKTQKLYIETKKKHLADELEKLKNGHKIIYVDNEGGVSLTSSYNNKPKQFKDATKEQVQYIISNIIGSAISKKLKKDILERKKPISKIKN